MESRKVRTILGFTDSVIFRVALGMVGESGLMLDKDGRKAI